MNTVRIAFLALLAAGAPAAPAVAQVLGAPDVEVSSPIQGFTPYTNQSFLHFDADWTADGRLVMAMVERTKYDLPRSDRLVIALRDPATGETRCLANFLANGWSIEHVSLCVPPRSYAVPGSMGLFDHARNKVYVALGVEAPVYSSLVNGTYQQRVRAVRLLSVSTTSPQAPLTLRIVNPANVGLMAVGQAAEAPRPELASYEIDSDYAVECAFVDPRNTQSGGGHVMIARSYDFGQSMQNAFFVTGPWSAAASNPSNPLGTSTYSRPAICHDSSAGRSLLALADVGKRVVRVASAAADTNAYGHLTSTTAPATISHHSPRIASRAGLVNVTYRVGVPGSNGPQPIDWFNTSLQGVRLQLPRLTLLSVSHADIRIDGNDALIAILQRENSSSTLEHAFEYSLRRYDQYSIPQPQRIDDIRHSWNFRGVAPVMALTPEHALTDRKGVLFLYSSHTTALGGNVMLDS